MTKQSSEECISGERGAGRGHKDRDCEQKCARKFVRKVERKEGGRGEAKAPDPITHNAYPSVEERSNRCSPQEEKPKFK